LKIKKIESIDYFDLIDQRFNTQTTEPNNMQTQTQSDILQQFSDMLKSHSIVVADRANLVKLLENIVDLCTQMPKTKLKAAVKAAAKTPAAAAKAAAKTPATAKKQPVRETLVGPADAGDCPVMSDLKAPARGRGRPRKADATAVTDNDAEKKKRGRPKKDKTVTISSNDDEDALIAKMIADVKKNAKQSPAVAVAEQDDDSTESELDEFNGELIRAEENHAEENHAEENHAEENHAEENHSEETSPVVANSVSPVHQVEPIHPAVPIEVEAGVEAGVVNKPKTKSKQAKEPKVKETKVKEPKAKEPKVKETKAKEPKVKEPKAKEMTKSIADVVPAPATPVVPVPATSVPATSATPLRENKASSDGNFYLMPNYPRESFTYNGKTYLRTETDNVYDTMTLEMIGVWDHLNHEIITAFDDEEVDELWLSDEE
jgi:hypothetical protein